MINNDKNHEYLTVVEAAQLMRVAPITVYRMLKDKKLPAMKFGKSWKINAAKLRALLEKEV